MTTSTTKTTVLDAANNLQLSEGEKSPSTGFVTATIVVWTTTTCASLLMMSWKLVQWRARKRARNSVQQVVESMKHDGPLIDYNDAVIYDRVIMTAMKRASKWMILSHQDMVHPMVGQVGGTGCNRKPMLTLRPDYILKPLVQDHRGIREIAFYEAIRIITQAPSHHVHQTYSAFLTGREPPHTSSRTIATAKVPDPAITNYSYTLSTVSSAVATARTYLDTLAMAIAIFVQDPVVLQSENALRDAWQNIQREMDVIRQLQKFTAPYYGVLTMKDQNLLKGTDDVGSQSKQVEWSHLDDAHLLLQDLTINYSKPCVMDLKMGVQTYEPDATAEKRAREFGKYPQQTQFGFRIVGMRFYDPNHPDADEKGYRYHEKSYGRSLTTFAQLMEAFRLYFSAGCTDMSPPSDANDDVTEADGIPAALSNANHRSNGHGNSPSKQCQRSSAALPNGMIRRRTVSNFLLQLRPLRRWFEENQSLRFYASSLLLIYEGDVEHSPNPDMVTLKMIDFGRVRREAGGDLGYITGLSTVRNIFEELLKEDEKRAASPCC